MLCYCHGIVWNGVDDLQQQAQTARQGTCSRSTRGELRFRGAGLEGGKLGGMPPRWEA
jgi:hypothetical protein